MEKVVLLLIKILIPNSELFRKAEQVAVNEEYLAELDKATKAVRRYLEMKLSCKKKANDAWHDVLKHIDKLDVISARRAS